MTKIFVFLVVIMITNALVAVEKPSAQPDDELVANEDGLGSFFRGGSFGGGGMPDGFSRNPGGFGGGFGNFGPARGPGFFCAHADRKWNVQAK